MEKKRTPLKPKLKIHDLSPRRPTKGGKGTGESIYSKTPPLSIPPDGFIISSNGGNGKER